ncbi:ribosomal maturation YjgA family protein [Paenibacillus sp. SEL1]
MRSVSKSVIRKANREIKAKFRWKAHAAYLIAVLFTILLGLGSRVFSSQLPEFVANHFGDALWACMIYFGLRMLWVNRQLSVALWGSLLFCFAIEFSQMYQAPWINHIRATTLGGLVLGKGFLTADLIRYTVGIVVSWAMDQGCQKLAGSNTRRDNDKPLK